jgi:UDP:flavonoid glycosyltransferase YjiC (YdhE family)
MPVEKQRVLFVPEAVTLAHVARLVSLAKSLDPTYYDICFASDPRYNNLLGHLPFPVTDVHTIPPAQFFSALNRGTPIYRIADLSGYVAKELDLFENFRPDVVVGDFRLSLDVSTKIYGVPYITVTNAYWSPYAELRYPVPDITLTRIFGVKIAQTLFDWTRPVAFHIHSVPLNQVRQKYGLPRLRADLRHIYTHADYTLYADVAEIVPTQRLPENHHFIGPIAWSPANVLPEWWNNLPASRPIIYVTLGSSGQSSLLPQILEAAADLPVTVIAATAGRVVAGAAPENAYVADFLPGDQAAKISNIVVCNGGSPTSYQGLAAGKPIVGIANNLDQYLNMSLIEAAGAGRLLRSGRISVPLIRETVRQILDNPDMMNRAQELKSVIASYSAPTRFANILDQIKGRTGRASGS